MYNAVILKVGDICPDCKTKVFLWEMNCRGAKERNEPLPTILACRCLHPGDTLCNCGNPCRAWI